MSIYGGLKFADEKFALKHDAAGLLSMVSVPYCSLVVCNETIRSWRENTFSQADTVYYSLI